MPRVRVNTKQAERAGTRPPRIKGTPPTPPADAAKQLQLMYNLVLHSVQPEMQLVAMQEKFPSITPDRVGRLRQDVERVILDSTSEDRQLKKAKQELRILSEISAARARNLLGPIAALEAEYSKVVGTHAPVRHQLDHNFSETFDSAFKQAVAALTGGQAAGLLDGEVVALGFNGEAVVEASGEAVE